MPHRRRSAAHEPRTSREKGLAKDADKLVRRLSLVALLLSRRGQPVSAAEIRSRVEGYPTMTEDAFKRRFYEDRAELAGLGIEIAAEPADDGRRSTACPPTPTTCRRSS